MVASLNESALARCDVNGSFDTVFGTNNKVKTNIKGLNFAVGSSIPI